jgi:hypothetical protein
MRKTITQRETLKKKDEVVELVVREYPPNERTSYWGSQWEIVKAFLVFGCVSFGSFSFKSNFSINRFSHFLSFCPANILVFIHLF